MFEVHAFVYWASLTEQVSINAQEFGNSADHNHASSSQSLQVAKVSVMYACKSTARCSQS